MKKLTPVASLGILAATILAANPASAAILTQTQTYTLANFTATDFQNSFSINKFNPALGGLLSVAVTITGETLAGYTLENTSTSSRGSTTGLSVGSNVSVVLANTLVNLVTATPNVVRTYSGNVTIANSTYYDATNNVTRSNTRQASLGIKNDASTADENATNNNINYRFRQESGLQSSDTESATYTDIPTLNEFKGVGVVGLFIEGIGASTSGLATGGIVFTSSTSARGDVTIVYTYDDSIAVPLPGAVWGLMMAGGAGAAMLRKKGKKSSVA